MNTAGRIAVSLFSFGLLVLSSGCTSRGMTITSLPPGAEVSINRRVVGVTPIRVGFTHYGTYRIELRREKYQTLVKEEPVRPPVYGYDPAALVADNFIPARLNDEIYLHYVMKAQDERADKDALGERDALLERAALAREGRVTHPGRGEEIVIALKRELKPEAGPGIEAVEDPLLVEKGGPGPLNPVITEIGGPQPEGPTLSKKLDNPAPPPDKRAGFVAPEEAKKSTTRVVRTPKEEELIYEEAAAKKDEKKDEKK